MKAQEIPQDSEQIAVNNISYSHGDIFRVVDFFYRLVEQDDLLKVPFQTVHDWPEHIRKLTHFWWIRLGGRPYLDLSYNPVEKHFFAGFNAQFLARWLQLFHETMDKKLSPEQAELWKMLSVRIGMALTQKNEFYKNMQEKSK